MTEDKKAVNAAKQINNELESLRSAKAKALCEKINTWNPDRDDIKQLVLMLEELRGSPEGYGKCDILDTLKSSKTQKEKIKIVKNYMKRTGDGRLLIVDKNGFCITDVNYSDPFDNPSDEPIIIEHIDDLIAGNVAEAEQCEKAQDEEREV